MHFSFDQNSQKSIICTVKQKKDFKVLEWLLYSSLQEVEGSGNNVPLINNEDKKLTVQYCTRVQSTINPQGNYMFKEVHLSTILGVAGSKTNAMIKKQYYPLTSFKKLPSFSIWFSSLEKLVRYCRFAE